MKPQYTTAAQCHKELARVMDQYGFKHELDAINSEYVKHKSCTYFTYVPSFIESDKWSFSIAEVEGKPVFPGDELYNWRNEKHTAPFLNDGDPMLFIEPHEWTWEPKKPKTVMVEMLREDVEWLTKSVWYGEFSARNERLKTSCAEALKESE